MRQGALTGRLLAGVLLALVVLAPASPGALARDAAAGRAATGRAAAGSSLDPALAKRLQARVEAFRRHPAVPGISAAIQLADGSTWTGVSGHAIIGAAAMAVHPDTPFEIASVTKTFVSAAILSLVDHGALSLADPLSRWLPGFPRAERITVRDLLQHTSGIRDIFDAPEYRALVLRRPDHPWTFAEILDMVGPPLVEPGTDWDYSNTNYVLLGRIIELVTGNPVSHVIRSRFLEPLGLTSTWFQDEEDVPVTVAMGYQRRPEGWRPESDGQGLRPTTSLATFVWAAGAMVSTPRDLATWARALYGGHVLSAASTAALLDVNDHDYGLGVRRGWLGDRMSYGHGGSLDGFETSMGYLPRLDAAVVVVWNRWPLETDVLADRLAETLVDALDPDTTPPVVGIPAFSLQVGSHVTLGRVPLTVSWDANDDPGRIVRVEARRRRDGGPWRAIPQAEVHKRKLDLDAPPGHAVTVAVRAIDDEGNASPWVESPAVIPRIVSDRSPAITLGGRWVPHLTRKALGGSLMASRTRGSSATIAFRGTALGLISTHARSRGELILDARAADATLVDLGVTPRDARLVAGVRTWPDSTLHRVVMQVVGTPGRPRVDIDGLVLLLQAKPAAAPGSRPPARRGSSERDRTATRRAARLPSTR